MRQKVVSHLLCCSGRLLHVVLLALQLGVHGVKWIFVHELGVQRQSLHHLHIQLRQLRVLSDEITHTHIHTRMTGLLKYSSVLTKSVFYGFCLKFLQTNVSEWHSLPVYILQLLINEGTHLIAGTCRKIQARSMTNQPTKLNQMSCCMPTRLLFTSCTPSQDPVYLPAGVTRHCQTGCLWDPHSGSSAGADPFCPERAQHSSNEHTREVTEEGSLMSPCSVRNVKLCCVSFHR